MSELKKSKIGERVKKIRTVLELTQSNFAKLMEVSPSLLRSIEHGNLTPNITFITALSQKLNVSLNYLISGHGDMFHSPGDKKRYIEDFSHDIQKDFFLYFVASAQLRYHILEEFKKYFINNKEFVMQDIEEYKKAGKPLDGPEFWDNLSNSF